MTKRRGAGLSLEQTGGEGAAAERGRAGGKRRLPERRRCSGARIPAVCLRSPSSTLSWQTSSTKFSPCAESAFPGARFRGQRGTVGKNRPVVRDAQRSEFPSAGGGAARQRPANHRQAAPRGVAVEGRVCAQRSASRGSHPLPPHTPRQRLPTPPGLLPRVAQRGGEEGPPWTCPLGPRLWWRQVGPAGAGRGLLEPTPCLASVQVGMLHAYCVPQVPER